MNRYDVQLVPCGSPEHRSDVASLRARGLPVPHDFSLWPSHFKPQSWLWCRVLDATGTLVTGFAIQLSHSRALPGMRIGRIERIGRALHGDVTPVIGQVLGQAASRIPRLLRLEVQVFDEISQRREAFAASIVAAGAHPAPNRRSYAHTLLLPIDRPPDELFKALSRRTRQDIGKFLESSEAHIAPIRDAKYKRRIRQLYDASFARTGGGAPALDIDAVLKDAAEGHESVLLGAFVADRPAPEHLVAFAWGRLHGDHVVYDVGGSEKSERLRHRPPGYGLIWSLVTWAHQRGAQWLDLGGIVPGTATANNPLAGIVAFKRRFSNDERRVAEEFYFEPNRPLAQIARLARSLAIRIGLRKDTTRLVCGMQ